MRLKGSLFNWMQMCTRTGNMKSFCKKKTVETGVGVDSKRPINSTAIHDGHALAGIYEAVDNLASISIQPDQIFICQ